MDLLWIVGLTIAFWKLIGRPVHDWFAGFKRVEIRGTHEIGAPPAAEPKPTPRGPDQILELDADP